MKQFSTFATTLALIATCAGCSKKDGEVTENTPAVPSAAQPVEQLQTSATPAATAVSAPLQNVTVSIQQGNYDAAVDTLVTTKTSMQNLSEADRAEFQQQVRNATTALLSAKANDPKAAAAYKRLSQAMTGR